MDATGALTVQDKAVNLEQLARLLALTLPIVRLRAHPQLLMGDVVPVLEVLDTSGVTVLFEGKPVSPADRTLLESSLSPLDLGHPEAPVLLDVNLQTSWGQSLGVLQALAAQGQARILLAGYGPQGDIHALDLTLPTDVGVRSGLIGEPVEEILEQPLEPHEPTPTEASGASHDHR